MIAEMCASATSKEITVPDIFSGSGPGQKIKAKRGDVIFRIGDRSDGMYFIAQGRVRLSVPNAAGKEATLALLGPNDLFGEKCLLLGRDKRVSNAYAESATDLVKVGLKSITHALSTDIQLANFLLKHSIVRMAEYEDALAYQITNNTERRLARALLHLSQYDSAQAKPVVIQSVTQEMLSNIVGANRSRLNGFMTKFRRLGYIEYGGTRGDASITVNPSLVAVLFETPPRKR
jgi:CRP/FNR family transcriptional regulator, cyclic AMP receptor protein